MACSIEMQACDRCGREVPSYAIFITRSAEGEAEWLCPTCAGQPDPQPASPLPTPQPDCA